MNQYERRKQRTVRELLKEVKLKEFYKKAKPKPIKVKKEREEWVKTISKSDTPSKTTKKVEKDITYEYEWERGLTKGARSNLQRVKASFYFKDFIARGLIPFTKEWRAESLRASKKLNYENRTEEEKRRILEKQSARAKRRREKDIEVEREKDRKRKARRRAEKGKEINEAQRQRYRANSKTESTKQRERRHLREPHRAIRAYTRLYSEGLLTYEQYVKSVDECVERAKQAEHKGLGRRAERREKEGNSGTGST
jgi:hypothetical protein